MSKNVPSPPDYSAATEQDWANQQTSNLQQTYANRPDVYTPWGAQTWSSQPILDASGQPSDYMSWTQNINLTPDQQAALESQQQIQAGRSDIAQGLIGQARSDLGTPMNWGALPAAGQGLAAQTLQRRINYSGLPELGTGGEYQQRAEDAIYNRAASRLDPQWQQREDQLRTRLINQGLTEESEAYRNAMGNLGMERTDAYEQARNAAITGSGAEASRLFGMDVSGRQIAAGERERAAAFANQAAQQALGQQQTVSGYQNQLRQQALAEQLQRRGLAINEQNALLGGQQVSMPGMPSFAQASNAGGTNLLGAAQMQNQAAMAQYGAQQAQQQALMSGIAGLVPFGFGGF